MKKKVVKQKKSHTRKKIISNRKAKQTSNVFSFYTMVAVFGCILLFLTGVLQVVKNNSNSKLPLCANTLSCIKDLSGKVSNIKLGMYEGREVSAPDFSYFSHAVQNPEPTSVLGANTVSGAKHIYVDLTQQRLYAFQGSSLIFNDSIASGKYNLTPTGTFMVWIKLQATLMAGGEGATSYYLPNVPWTMYFYNAKIGKSEGYSMHGEYWYNPNTGLGQPESHGCVNMRISEAKALYDWIDPPTLAYTTYATSQNPGTLVTIYGTTPNNGLVGTQFYDNNVSYDAGTQIN